MDREEKIRTIAFEILAEHGTQTTVDELKEYVDNPKAVLKLEYCLEAIEAAIDKFYVE